MQPQLNNPNWSSLTAGSVRLRFSTERWSLISALIRWYNDSKMSHVEYEFDGGWTLGARFSLLGKIARLIGWERYAHRDGVQLRPPSALRKQTLIGYKTHINLMGAAVWVYENRLDVPYDLLGVTGIFTARGYHASGDDFCSEVCTEGAVNGSQIKVQNCAPHATSPRDMWISLNLQEAA